MSSENSQTPVPPVPMKENFLSQCRALITSTKLFGAGAAVMAAVFGMMTVIWYAVPIMGQILRLSLNPFKAIAIGVSETYRISHAAWETIATAVLQPDYTVDRHLEKISMVTTIMAGGTTILVSVGFATLVVTSLLCVAKMYRFHQDQKTA